MEMLRDTQTVSMPKDTEVDASFDVQMLDGCCIIGTSALIWNANTGMILIFKTNPTLRQLATKAHVLDKRKKSLTSLKPTP